MKKQNEAPLHYKLCNNPSFFHNHSLHLHFVTPIQIYVLTAKFCAKKSLKAIDIAKNKEKYMFCYHLGRHLEYLKMFNDDKVPSVRFINANVKASRINQEEKL